MGKTIESNFNLMPRHGDAPPCIYNVCTVAFATLAFFIINALNINSASAASYVANYVGANISGNWVNITSSGNVSIDVVGAAGGALGVAKHTIYSETNSTTGYRLYVSSTNANAGTGYTSLYYDGDTTSEYQLTGINAATPASFSTANSWGYAVPDGVTTPAYTVYDAVIASGGTSDPSAISSLKWLGITKNYQPIMSSSTSNEGNPAATDVYYGVYADDTARKGSYRNLVVYTGFVEGGDRVFVTPSAFYGNKRLSIVTEHEGSANPITLDQVRVAIYNKNHPTDQVGTCSNITLADGKDGTTGHPLEFTCDFTPGSDIAEDTLYGIEVQVDAKGNGIFISYTNDTAFTYAKTLEQVATMQDATPQLCSNSPIGSVYHLKDSRTNASYLVTKMADGNCWMTQNLWLAANTEYIGSVGTSFSTGTSSNSGWNGTSTSGTQFYQGTHSDNTEDSNSNTGSFFTWKKATADTGGGYGQSGTVTNSVCPQGWKLPSGGSGGDFDKLYTTAYSSNKTNLNNHWSGSLIGSCYSSNCTDSQGSYAFWWASTQYSNNNGHSMHLNSSAFYPTNSNYKGVGFPVRCMLDTTPYDYTITYNANGGTGAPTAQSGSDTHVTISTTEPTRNGFTFLGWGTSADATTPAYLSGKTIPLSSANRNSILYAVWESNLPASLTFQTFTTSQCNAITIGDTIIVKDERDQKTYLVSRLKMSASDAVGKCWMVQNLALAQSQALTPADSNVSNNYTIPNTKAFSVNGAQDAIVPSHKNAQADAANNTGGYYTWATATAGTNPSSGEANSSICPKGWKLPTNTDFTNVYSGYGNDLSIFSSAWRSALLGYYMNGSLKESGTRSFWWSTSGGSDLAHSAEQGGSGFGVHGYYYKMAGHSVRCIFGS